MKLVVLQNRTQLKDLLMDRKTFLDTPWEEQNPGNSILNFRQPADLTVIESIKLTEMHLRIC